MAFGLPPVSSASPLREAVGREAMEVPVETVDLEVEEAMVAWSTLPVLPKQSTSLSFPMFETFQEHLGSETRLAQMAHLAVEETVDLARVSAQVEAAGQMGSLRPTPLSAERLDR